MNPKKILVVAQTPPPVHGQALMMQYLLEGLYEKVEFHHIRMAFSSSINEVGSFRFGKVLHLASLILRVAWMRIRSGSTVLYYSPSGPNLVPFLRDIFFLLSTRWMFSKVVFHFHASGISIFYQKLPFPLKLLFRLVYNSPDLSIQLSPSGPNDALFLKSKTSIIVPNGIPDVAGQRGRSEIGNRRSEVRKQNSESCATSGAQTKQHLPSVTQTAVNQQLITEQKDIPVLLFMGTLSEQKGVLVLLEACAILKRRGVAFGLCLAGRAESDLFEKKIKEVAESLDLSQELTLTGLVTGDDKWNLLASSDVFCFPSFYSSEAFPLVLLEAAQFSLPVVSTRWRGIPDIVLENETGFLVELRDPAATADRLEQLLKDSGLRFTMGRSARKRFEKEYTVDIFRKRIEEALAKLA